MRSELLRSDVHNIDVMPRSLAMTLLVGAAIGGSFWAALIAMVVR